ncbi:MAG TPA: hypothetical protein VMR31_11010 [Myxococcota bacterium]|nr:hypothetical protein [Myxococcota bacterium]
MPERSIHDSRVISYEVDGERRRIVLHTRFDERVPVEHTDVIFEGVLAYHFENDNFGNILFSIEEVPVAQLVAGCRSLFEEGSKFAWPGPWNESPESSLDHIRSCGGKAFELSSSYGLDGWVIAESYRVEAVR